jgi:hypothetical protein
MDDTIMNYQIGMFHHTVNDPLPSRRGILFLSLRCLNTWFRTNDSKNILYEDKLVLPVNEWATTC